jgi:hypothetical protein
VWLGYFLIDFEGLQLSPIYLCHFCDHFIIIIIIIIISLSSYVFLKFTK